MKRTALILLMVLLAWPAAGLEKFMVCTGSNLEKPAVREAAYGFDYLVTTAYGWSIIKEDSLLAPKAVVYFNVFANSYYVSQPHDLQPAPADMGHERMPLVWGFGYGAVAYDLTDPLWPDLWSHAVVDFLMKTDCAGVLLDDWWPEHEWWTDMSIDHYRKVHPQGIESILRMLEVRVATRADSLGKVCLLNGPAQTRVPSQRYWERWGWDGTWNLFGIWTRAQSGDFIYSSTGEGSHRWLAKVVGSLKSCPVGLGLPDGQPMVDPDGQLCIPKPEEY